MVLEEQSCFDRCVAFLSALDFGFFLTCLFGGIWKELLLDQATF